MPEFINISGNMNVVADILSHLNKNNGPKLLDTDNKVFLLAKALTANSIKNLGNKELKMLCGQRGLNNITAQLSSRLQTYVKRVAEGQGIPCSSKEVKN
eukprot:4814395-Ditylum_brightwellii.AAC.1